MPAEFRLRPLDDSQEFHRLNAIGPFDGRYAEYGERISPWLSEFALIRGRLYVETEYLISLSEAGFIPQIPPETEEKMREVFVQFSLHEGTEVKQLEKSSDHDVVALVSFMKAAYNSRGMTHLTEYIHAGPTSEDIDNIAWRILIRGALTDVLIPEAETVIDNIIDLARATRDFPVVARTHGQVAAADTFGRKLLVFIDRLQKQKGTLDSFQFQGKFNGMVGTWSGQRAAFPNVPLTEWINFSDQFVSSFGFEPIHFTSQNNPHDDIANLLQSLNRFDNILHGFSVDMWSYISRGFLKRRPKEFASGSSTSPGKANPWQLEHGTAMLRMATGQADVLIQNIVEYRLERQLTDKTLLRFIGQIFATNLNAWRSVSEELKLLTPAKDRMAATITEDLSYLSEALQLILRTSGITNAYEIVKSLTQGKTFSSKDWNELTELIIKQLNISDPVVITKIRGISPDSFIQDASTLTQIGLDNLKRTND